MEKLLYPFPFKITLLDTKIKNFHFKRLFWQPFSSTKILFVSFSQIDSLSFREQEQKRTIRVYKSWLKFTLFSSIPIICCDMPSVIIVENRQFIDFPNFYFSKDFYHIQKKNYKSKKDQKKKNLDYYFRWIINMSPYFATTYTPFLFPQWSLT